MTATAAEWNGQGIGAEVIGMTLDADETTPPSILVSARDGSAFRLTSLQLVPFLRLHSSTFFAFEDAVGSLASWMTAVEGGSRQEVTNIVWDAVRSGRVIDVPLARATVKLATRQTFATSTDTAPADLARVGQALLRQLRWALEDTKHPVAGPGGFGLLGLGLHIGAALALKVAELRGAVFPDSSRTRLLALCDQRFEQLARRLREESCFTGLLARWPASAAQILDGNARVWEWVQTQRARIRDHRGVELVTFIDARPRALEGPFEDWPEWAVAVPYSPHWAALRRLCRLRLFLDQLEGEVVHPRFEVLPRLRMRGLDLGGLQGVRLTDFLAARGGHVLVRVELPDLRVRAFADVVMGAVEHKSPVLLALSEGRDPAACLGAMSRAEPYDSFVANWESGSKPHNEEYRVARALLALAPLGIWGDGLTDLVEVETGVRRTGGDLRNLVRRLPEVETYLRDNTWERLGQSLNDSPDRLRERFPLGSAPKVAYYFANPRMPMGRIPDFDLPSYLRERGGQAGRLGSGVLRFHMGPEVYRLLTDETIVGSSGTVRGGLPWVTARSEAIVGLAEDVLKAVLLELAVDGYRIVGLEPEAVVVEVPFDPSTDQAGQIEKIAGIGAGKMLSAIPIDCRARPTLGAAV
jgi:hypothetical protein